MSNEGLNRILHANILVLNLSNNNLKSSSFLYSVPNLVFLNVSNNDLQELDALSHCIYIEEVIFSHNKVSLFPNMSKAKDLALVDASFNLLHSFENLALLSANRKLRVCNLSHNPITRKVDYRNILKKILTQVLAFDVFDVVIEILSSS